jgi:hypothetical protein
MTHPERPLCVDLATIRSQDVIFNALDFLSLPTSIKIKVSDYY